MIKIDIDFSTDFEANWLNLEPYINRGMCILHYTHEGPGGGNPNFLLEFPTLDLLREFADQYECGPITDLQFEEFLKLHQL